MAFIESPRFPERIAYNSRGGVRFRTAKVETLSGREYRVQRWPQGLRHYDLAHSVKLQTEIDELDAYFHAVGQGDTNMFRFKDIRDYAVTQANGFIGTGVGDGTPVLQLRKRYSAGSNVFNRDIRKPVASGATGYRNAVALVVGASPGQIAIDYTTGLLTFVADDTEAITGHTPGATHVFTTAADISVLSIGEKVYLTGVTGTAATTLNGLAHTISNKTGAGPYTWTLSTNTTGLTASSGTAFAYPQASDVLTWEGPFDIPVRFDIDEFMPYIVGPGKYRLDSLPLVERRV